VCSNKPLSITEAAMQPNNNNNNNNDNNNNNNTIYNVPVP